MSRGVARWCALLGVALLSACTPATTHRVAFDRPVANVLPAGTDVAEVPAGDVAVTAPAVFTGEPPAPTPEPPQITTAAVATSSTTIPSAGGVWAVIVGIDDYPGTKHDLRLAGSDAATTDAALARYGVPPEQRLRLANGAATAANLRRSLQWLDAHAGPEATAVFFYAGHVRKVHGHEAMVGADGNVVLDSEVADLLRPLRAGRTWLVIAACYGGGFTEALAPGRILTAAAPADKLAYENTAVGHSYLVEYLVQRAMLEGAADGSVEGAYAWAYAALRKDHPDRLPVQFDQVPGDLSLRTGALMPPAPKTAPASPPPTTTTTTPPPTTTTTQPRRCLLALNGKCG